MCCKSWGHKESDMTERLSNNCLLVEEGHLKHAFAMESNAVSVGIEYFSEYIQLSVEEELGKKIPRTHDL